MNSSTLPRIAVLMSVYRNDQADHLKIAVESILTQTYDNFDFYIVFDGPVDAGIEGYLDNLSDDRVNVRKRGHNCGLANSLAELVVWAESRGNYEYYARMDADDISMPDRFERQIAVFDENPELEMVGGWIREINMDATETLGYRKVPERHDAIIQMMKARCPFNHQTLMMRPELLKRAGGYSDHFRLEDYYLWFRMMAVEGYFYNIPDVLVDMRAGYDMLGRRRGWNYMVEDLRLHTWAYRQGLLNTGQYLRNAAVRAVARLLPTGLLSAVYKLLRR